MPHVNAVIDLLADDLEPAMLARLLTVSAVGTEALLGAGRLAAAEKLARASVAAATFLSPDDPAALTARGYLARTLVPPVAAQTPRPSTASCSPTGSGCRARITWTPWAPGMTPSPPRWACRAATATPSSSTVSC